MRKIALTVTALAAACWAGSAAAGDKGPTVELDGLKSTTPASWKAPGGKLGTFRIYQFALPKAKEDKEDAELVIFAFGPGGGGGIKENIKRWQGTFAPPQGKTFDDITKVETFKVGSVPVTYVDISGTYLFKAAPFVANAKVTPKENFRMIGVVFESDKEGPYFMRLTGPARTVEAHKKDFDNWLKGFK